MSLVSRKSGHYCHVSGIITRVDNNGKYIDKVVKVNKLIIDVLEKLKLEVIDNSNIKSEHLAKKGLHLSLGKGNAILATKFKQVIKICLMLIKTIQAKKLYVTHFKLIFKQGKMLTVKLLHLTFPISLH